jgi:hypothetical protein
VRVEVGVGPWLSVAGALVSIWDRRHRGAVVNAEGLHVDLVPLPDDAQAEIVQALIESRAEDFGIYRVDDEQNSALTSERS